MSTMAKNPLVIVENVLSPILNNLQAMNSSIQSQDNENLQNQYDCISALFGEFKIAQMDSLTNETLHKFTKILEYMWSILMLNLYNYQTAYMDVEKWSRCIKYIIRSYPTECSISLLENMVHVIVQVYNTHGHSSLLYLAGIIVKVYGALPNCQEGLLELVIQLQRQTKHILSYTANPDTPPIRNGVNNEIQQKVNIYDQHFELVEDFFHLLRMYVVDMRAKFLKTEVAFEGFHFGVDGLKSMKFMTFSAICSYISEFICSGFKDMDSTIMVDKAIQQNMRHIIGIVLDGCGGAHPLPDNFMECLCYVLRDLFRYAGKARLAIHENRAKFEGVVKTDVESVQQCFTQVLSKYPDNILVPRAKQQFIDNVFVNNDFKNIDAHLLTLSQQFFGKNQIIV